MQSNIVYPSSTPVAEAYLFVSVQLKWLKDNLTIKVSDYWIADLFT